MKTNIIFALLASVLLLSNCGKDKNPTDTPPVSLLEMTQVLSAAEDKFIEFGQPSGTTPQASLGLTAEWLKTQPNVSSAIVADDNSGITIQMTSGMSGIFFLDIMDQDSLSISRGGSSSGNLFKVISTKPSKNKIENKKVLLCYPNQDEFYKEAEVKKIIDRLKNSDLGLEVTEKVYEEVSPDLVRTFGNFGLVIINTHGFFPDCFMSGSKIKFEVYDSTDVLAKAWVIYHFSQQTYDDLSSGLLRIGVHIRIHTGPDWIKKYTKSNNGFTIFIGGEYIKNLPDMPKTIIFGNFCYSGQSNPEPGHPNPIGASFESKNLLSYYCYDDGKGRSHSVNNGFAKAMEDSLTRSFVVDNDSTGNSYLSSKGDEFKDPFNILFFKQYGAKDYSYSNCVTTFTDDRDGIVYKAVCIGKQNWMAENLRYNAPGSVFYEDKPENGPIYGKLYDGITVMNGASSSEENPSGVRGICPKGWHLPSPAEWDQLLATINYKGGDLKDKNLWLSPNTGATNLYGFNALGGGYFEPSDGFTQLNKIGFWFTTRIGAYNQHLFYQITYNFDVFNSTHQLSGLKASCRCLKD
jgi:uncharacterized protein (TIGR02145 family)